MIANSSTPSIARSNGSEETFALSKLSVLDGISSFSPADYRLLNRSIRRRPVFRYDAICTAMSGDLFPSQIKMWNQDDNASNNAD